jgi:hypothetical protein
MVKSAKVRKTFASRNGLKRRNGNYTYAVSGARTLRIHVAVALSTGFVQYFTHFVDPSTGIIIAVQTICVLEIEMSKACHGKVTIRP